jgi:hypothetical protein
VTTVYKNARLTMREKKENVSCRCDNCLEGLRVTFESMESCWIL